jgi:hypothetical protein
MRLRKRMTKVANNQTFKDEFYDEEGKLDCEKIVEKIIEDGVRQKEYEETESWDAEPDVGVMYGGINTSVGVEIIFQLSELVKDEKNIDDEELNQLRECLSEKVNDDAFVWEETSYFASSTRSGDYEENDSSYEIKDGVIKLDLNYSYDPEPDYPDVPDWDDDDRY